MLHCSDAYFTNYKFDCLIISSYNVIHHQAAHTTEWCKSSEFPLYPSSPIQPPNMPPKSSDSAVNQEDCLLLAIKAYQNGQFQSKAAAATAFDVPPQTLQYQLCSRTARSDTMPNSQKLTKSEEYSLKKWILDMDK